ncbi:hypothetical protein BGX33_009091 [Mortierella sp. NVP41]|nr:hypothetical protein BGX33_009091 [Mortierella sp. NVP41]
MQPFQRFHLGDLVLSLAVRQDSDGPPYSQLTDVQETFPGTILFKQGEVILNFLEDESKKKYDPKRIAHFPDDIIDVVCTPQAFAPLCPPGSLSNRTSALTVPHSPHYPTQMLSTDSIDLSVSNFSLQPLPSSKCDAYQPMPIACPMAVLSSIASDIVQFQHQLDRSTDQQSVYHQQLLEQLVQLLREQSEAKKRDEQALAELAAAKERDEEMYRMQQQTIDRLIVAQQRIEAVLVQTYELHEYPIPRLFVILPDSYETWDLRSLLLERFRLYFLCECGEECRAGSSDEIVSSDQSSTTTAATPTSPIPVKNRIHLAKHEGYELSRPKEFLESYGPYVLGMLRILKHCLAVAAVVSPVVGIAHGGVKEITEGVKTISECTMAAVDKSINFLEQKLDDTTAPDDPAVGENEREEDNVFEKLAALEGADLRRLDTFLRNNDEDKILGNLYRITTEQGHVKWVCFEHYQERYRATALFSFVQYVEAAGGVYDAQLRSIAINLKSSTSARDFFRRLISQAPAVEGLDVTLDWKFRSTDLVMLVEMLSKSNVKTFKLDPNDIVDGVAVKRWSDSRMGRYHPLLELLSNKNLRSLQFSNIYSLGLCTSDLPTNHGPSWLQSFHFYGPVSKKEDSSRLTNILSHCPGLVDLRLISQGEVSVMEIGLRRAIHSLKKLQRLHVFGWTKDISVSSENGSWSNLMSLKELVCGAVKLNNHYWKEVIRRSNAILETLVIFADYRTVETVDELHLTPPAIQLDALHPIQTSPPVPLASEYSLSKLTHLDLQVDLTNPSLKFLSSFLPRLGLIHFGCDMCTIELLKHCNYAILKSLSISQVTDTALQPLLDVVSDPQGPCHVRSLRIHNSDSSTALLVRIVKAIPLKRLYLSRLDNVDLPDILRGVNLSNLQVLSICEIEYRPALETELARRRDEFTESLVVELDARSQEAYAKEGGAIRTTKGSSTALASHRVKLMGVVSYAEHHYQFLQPILPAHSY